MTPDRRLDRLRPARRVSLAVVFAAFSAAGAGGCDSRPLLYPPAEGAGIDAGDGAGDAATDSAGVTPGACAPGDALLGFSLCGVVDGKSVRYIPPYGLDSEARGREAVGFEGAGPDYVWFSIWGTDPWRDNDPHQVSGWLLQPPASWVGPGAWICGQAGSITRHADDSIDATLSALSLLPACGEAGGPETLNADVIGGVVPFSVIGAADGCEIGFRANDTHVTFIVPACPQMGVPLPLDGTRVVFGDASFPQDIPVTSACLGAGAQLTLLPDALPQGASHLLINVPSMSVPAACAGTPASGQLDMSVAALHPG